MYDAGANIVIVGRREEKLKTAAQKLGELNIPMAGTARTGCWCQPIRANIPMVPASEPLITSFNSVYFSH
ncbi:MAG: hypothetical protein PUH88_00880 [Lachnospiraceae bacterium]|nr:hypothetical protein [Lachnospiraceae bacterium]